MTDSTHASRDDAKSAQPTGGAAARQPAKRGPILRTSRQELSDQITLPAVSAAEVTAALGRPSRASLSLPPAQLMSMQLQKLADEIDLLWETFEYPAFTPAEADLVRRAAEVVADVGDIDGDPEADFGARRVIEADPADEFSTPPACLVCDARVCQRCGAQDVELSNWAHVCRPCFDRSDWGPF